MTLPLNSSQEGQQGLKGLLMHAPLSFVVWSAPSLQHQRGHAVVVCVKDSHWYAHWQTPCCVMQVQTSTLCSCCMGSTSCQSARTVLVLC